MTHDRTLAARAASVDAALAALFCEPEITREIRLNESLRYSVVGGGKRLRPVLLLAFAELGGVDEADAMDFACAVELIHTYSLIHDDLPCMDDGETRRGRPASHRVFGEAGAVLAGDGLLNAAFELMLSSRSSVAAEYRLAAAYELARAAGRQGMIAGQSIDIENENGRFFPDVEQLTRLCLLKTGAIIRGACLAGLRLGGIADSARLGAAGKYAENLGLAFQIRDDVLDVCGDAAALGKSVGRDEGNGKVTFAALLGADGCEEEIKRLTEEAVAALAVFGDCAFLRDLAYRMAGRDK